MEKIKKTIKEIFNKAEMKKRLPFALLAGFTSSLMFFMFGVLEIFAVSRDEFLFSVTDFIGYLLLLALGAALIIAALIMFLPKTVSLCVFGIVVWFIFMGYIQTLFLNVGASLDGDTGQTQSIALVIIDAVIWAVTGIFIVAGAMMMEKKAILKKIYLIGVIALLVMQTAGCASHIGDITRDKDDTPTESVTETQTADTTTADTTTTDALTDIQSSEAVTGAETTGAETTGAETTGAETTGAETTGVETTDAVTDAQTTEAVTDKQTEEVTTDAKTEEVTTAAPATETDKPDEPKVIDAKNAYLTTRGLNKVTSGKNIIIFIIDRFDVSYYNDLLKKEPDFFNKLDGFTYFSDNISLFSRTWPAVPTMITGVDNDFSLTANDYFTKAFTESPFLNDLKANDYKIKIYTQKYYCYRDGTPLVGLADNISVATGYTISDRSALVGNLLALSAYRYSPNALKDSINISSASFSGIVELNGAAPLYELDDPDTCAQILKGLSVEGGGNSYTFIHFNGCHAPFNMDANARRVEEASSEEQLRGCFKTIYFYLDELKRLGLYDDATVVITGDHPRARDDKKVPEQPRLTALFVKPSDTRGGLDHSSAQVSQENLIPTLVKSAGIKTSHDYGRSYFEIPENENNVRYHKFEMSGDRYEIVKFKVVGKGDDFDNWKIESRQELSDSFYK